MTKQLSTWKIAFINFIIMFFLSFIMYILLSMIMINIAFIFINAPADESLYYILNFTSILIIIVIPYLSQVISSWIAMFFSAKYICNKYEIKNNETVIRLSVAFYAILVFGYYFSLLIENFEEYPLLLIIQWLGSALIGSMIFYIAGKKYIRNN